MQCSIVAIAIMQSIIRGPLPLSENNREALAPVAPPCSYASATSNKIDIVNGISMMCLAPVSMLSLKFFKAIY